MVLSGPACPVLRQREWRHEYVLLRPAAELLAAIQSGVRHLDCDAQVLEQGDQAADHPVHPAIPETAYLKAFYVRVVAG